MGSNEQTGRVAADHVRIISRRMIKPPSDSEEAVNIHLTPWDLCLLTIDYVQKGILLPKPPAGAAGERLVDTLASSFARALGKFYPFAGRLVAEPHDGGTVGVLLRCTGEGAEFIHAVAPRVAVADIIGSLHISFVVCELFPLNHVLSADAATESLPVLSAQVTELADGVFISMSMNHSVGDGTAFWEFFNTWSEINRGGVDLQEVRTPAPAHQRFFIDTSPVPIRLPVSKLQDVVRRFERPTVQECFFTFSSASIQKLKARANSETDATVVAISSLHALLAHVWRAVSRARRLPPGQETSHSLLIGCRGRVKGIPEGYLGNAAVFGKASSTVGEILDKGLGWTAWQLSRVVASFDEAAMADWVDRWTREPNFVYAGDKSVGGAGAAVATRSSPRFDVFGNDFGWGKPVAVRSGPGNKTDGKVTVFEGGEHGGSMSLEVCIAPDALQRLLVDEEFMDVVTVSMPYVVSSS
ncbi:uncharacterized acetyltransferase At3g50280-like [Lolium perenne]|uniref:uncharacterized acetyltransferase At3g50280-like n=1 Tax=Lolium perenne TaxID=4522 RepID=UPI0021F513B0|nr:uncharacterized acetyltransferase At3g50280-like [Lolium perenne]